MTSLPGPLPHLLLGAGLLAAGLAAPSARASGYYLLEADLRAGVEEHGHREGGLGMSLYSDELNAWVGLGDPTVDGGRRVKQWWLESLALGPTMGTLPPAMHQAGFDEPERAGSQALWIPFRSWRFGSDYTAGRWLEWDASSHVLLNLGVLTRKSPRSILFGPTLGVGANLTWWEGWRGNDTQLINTGKLTAEAGWVAGVCMADVVYGQARVLGWVDTFGLHQHQVRVAGLLGVTGIEWGVPLGFELTWELEWGDDRVDTLPAQSHNLSLGLSWRAMPRDTQRDAEAVLEALKRAAPPPEDTTSPALPPAEEPAPADDAADDTPSDETALDTSDTSDDAPADPEAPVPPPPDQGEPQRGPVPAGPQP